MRGNYRERERTRRGGRKVKGKVDIKRRVKEGSGGGRRKGKGGEDMKR